MPQSLFLYPEPKGDGHRPVLLPTGAPPRAPPRAARDVPPRLPRLAARGRPRPRLLLWDVRRHEAAPRSQAPRVTIRTTAMHTLGYPLCGGPAQSCRRSALTAEPRVGRGL